MAFPVYIDICMGGCGFRFAGVSVGLGVHCVGGKAQHREKTNVYTVLAYTANCERVYAVCISVVVDIPQYAPDRHRMSDKR